MLENLASGLFGAVIGFLGAVIATYLIYYLQNKDKDLVRQAMLDSFKSFLLKAKLDHRNAMSNTRKYLSEIERMSEIFYAILDFKERGLDYPNTITVNKEVIDVESEEILTENWRRFFQLTYYSFSTLSFSSALTPYLSLKYSNVWLKMSEIEEFNISLNRLTLDFVGEFDLWKKSGTLLYGYIGNLNDWVRSDIPEHIFIEFDSRREAVYSKLKTFHAKLEEYNFKLEEVLKEIDKIDRFTRRPAPNR